MKMGKIKKLGAICLAAAMLFTGCASKSGDTANEDKKSYTIGVTQIVEHPALDSAREGFVAGLKEAGFEDNVTFVNKNAQGDMGTAQIIAQGFVDDKVDMIFAIATPVAQAAFNTTKDIPIMISAVTDPVSAGLVNSNEEPGTNVSGTSDAAPVDLQFKLLKDLGVNPKKVGFIYNTSEKNSEVQLEVVKEEVAKLGWEVEPLGITSITEIEQGLDVLLDKVDVLYVPTDNMVASSIQLVANKAIDKKIPVLGAEPKLVEGGALATCGVDYFELGRRTGLMAAEVLSGADISKLAVEKAQNPGITINGHTAKKLGIDISSDLRDKSTIVGE